MTSDSPEPGEPTTQAVDLEHARAVASSGIDADPGVALTGPDLASSAARGAAVTLTGQGLRILLQFTGVVVLARLLDPRDYGLLAVVVVVVGIGEIFRDFGLSNAAIQARSLSTAQRDSLFWVNSAIGVVLSAIVFAAAPLVATVFHEAPLTNMVRATAITFTFNGVGTQYRADLTRRLRFGRLVSCDIIGQGVGLALGVAFAASGAGYWALVAQLVGQAAAALIMVVLLAGWLPGRPRRDGDIRPFLSFGKNLAFASIINYLSNNLDTLTIAIRLGSVPLGIYNRGFSLLMSPLNQLRSPATTVALPVLSRLRDDYHAAGEYVKRGQLAFGYTICAGLAICAGGSVPVVHLVLGPRWSAVAPVLAFLAIAGASTMLAYAGFWVYLSRGLGRELLRYTVATLVLQAACIFTGSIWGVDGVAGGYMVAAVLEWPLSLCWLSRLTYIPLRDLLTGAARVTACGCAAGVAAWSVTRLTPNPAADLNVVFSLAAGVAVYLLAIAAVPQVRRDARSVVVIARRMARR